MSKICIPIRAKSLKEFKVALKKAQPQADLIEVWLDSLKDVSVENVGDIIKLVKKPLIVTCKAKQEKGDWKQGETKRLNLLLEACKQGADFVDIGVHTNDKLTKNLIKQKPKSTQLIISWHNFNRTPSLKSLKKTVEKALNLGANIVKIATFAKDKGDNYTIFELICWFTENYKQRNIIALCMGKKGELSRVHSTGLGAFLTFAALSKSQITAPGQLTVAQMQQALKQHKLA